ncbi:uncharacterized protein BO97DRAFT_353665 [Aspergillus homomorphus CBS 101889]|uniref:EKC/KEOPS complex subunit GON7 n=1 Tax=Aspergillus homomorphus (strain CBS 101889) TaxID=1450537 RepID=A0A395HL34_ASPHC|nr:hypothetical protein BO97DRAFT_353665 [Aspergillus homomorphus CBS 101889]RAL08567.1 hypothetical protein BO97DRAFT_353665 [Aspergillus homomorphus CBS 101889]
MSTTTPTQLRAVYSAPQQQSRTFEQPIAAPLPSSAGSSSSDNVKAKVTYLAELRKQVPTLQNEINVFLTEKMEEDKKAADAQGRQLSEKEAKEEENYGEEVVEEDDA